MHWPDHGYELVPTEDGSPTLRWLRSENQETMHHRGGAYSETQEIYGDPLREALRLGARSAISVGLGLGYNEILIAVEGLRNALPPQEFSLLSFESEEVLTSHFLQWLESERSDFVYDEIFRFFAQDAPSLKLAEVKNWLRQVSWRLQGALEKDFSLDQKYEIVFYDAFSSKTSPHLWSEEFLKDFFARACAPTVVVTTYACTGALKRALRALGFVLSLPEGFHSKRNRTLARRN